MSYQTFPPAEGDRIFSIKDSGEREEFETGSRRDTRKGKGRFDLIPPGPHLELAIHYEQGAEKYDDNNWKKGQPLMRYIDSAERHLNALKSGEAAENHAIAVVWNMFAYRWTLVEIEAGRLPDSLDNRPPEMRITATPLSRDWLQRLKPTTNVLDYSALQPPPPPLDKG